MHKERLLKLAERMDETKPKKFYIGSWMSPSIDEKRVIKNFDPETKEVALEGFCGTVCCVLGHAAFMPEFREEGLTILATKFTDWYLGRDSISNGLVAYRNPKTGRITKDPIRAGQRFFDLPKSHAECIFATGSETYSTEKFYGATRKDEITPKKVAKALRRYVEEGNMKWARY